MILFLYIEQDESLVVAAAGIKDIGVSVYEQNIYVEWELVGS